MSEAPPFWFQKPGIPAWILSPLSLVYGRVAGKRMQLEPKYVSSLPVLCVGNFVVGGAGKTPTVLALAKLLKSMQMRPGFLSRGYGGTATAPLMVNPDIHTAHDVGDEALLLARIAPTVVTADRPAGAAMLENERVDVIIMDDGFQNPSLYKDLTLAVVDARRGIGNGFCIPAGPLRAALPAQLSKASAVLLIGGASGATGVIRHAAKMAKPILQASFEVINKNSWEGRKVLAFAGIADPEKFYESLEGAGAEILARKDFEDHHMFSETDCTELMDQARDERLILATTEKDHVRLQGMGKAQNELHRQSDSLAVELVFENSNYVEMLIRQALDAAREKRRNMADALKIS